MDSRVEGQGVLWGGQSRAWVQSVMLWVERRGLGMAWTRRGEYNVLHWGIRTLFQGHKKAFTKKLPSASTVSLYLCAQKKSRVYTKSDPSSGTLDFAQIAKKTVLLGLKSQDFLQVNNLIPFVGSHLWFVLRILQFFDYFCSFVPLHNLFLIVIGNN